MSSEEPGVIHFVMAALSLAIITLFLTSFWRWFVLWRQKASLFGSSPLLEPTPRQRPFWSVVYALLFYVVVIGCSLVFTIGAGAIGVLDLEALREAAANASEGTAEDGVSSISVPQILISSLSMVGATLGMLLILIAMRSDALKRLGLVPREGMVRLGLVAAWMILPPTMVMMAIVSMAQEYSHPVLEALAPEDESGPNLRLFAVLFFSTALVTPIVEEFWFRGLLQGGLQRLADLPADLRRAQARRVESAASIDTESNNQVSAETSEAELAVESGNPYQSPVATREAPELVADESAPAGKNPAVTIATIDAQTDWIPTAIWPIFASSLLFAIAHWGQGLAPIPLFVLSIGLGYLYRQTGSLIPCIVVHFVLNGFTMSATLLEMLK